MTITRQEVQSDLEKLVAKAFSYAGSVDLGEERIAAFEFAEALRRIQRQGGARVMLDATNPFNFEQDDSEDEDWEDE